MPHPHPPQQEAGDQKKETSCRKQAVPPFAAIQKKKRGIILDAGIRNQKGSEQKDPFPVNIHRVFSIFPGSVRKDIHKFQPFQGKKTNRRIDKKNTGKECGPSCQHKKDGKYLGRAPDNPACRQSISKHHRRLDHSSDTGEFNPLSQNLENQAARPYHNPVKNTIPYDGGKGIETPGENFRQAELHQGNPETEQYFLIAVAFDRMEPPEHEVYSYKYIKGYEELSHTGQKKRGFILHGAFQLDHKIMPVKPEAVGGFFPERGRCAGKRVICCRCS